MPHVSSLSLSGHYKARASGMRKKSKARQKGKDIERRERVRGREQREKENFFLSTMHPTNTDCI